jgi:phosphate:Na+ symporter
MDTEAGCVQHAVESGLREGRPETLETTSLRLDVLRDFKRTPSHICSVAYPVLECRPLLSRSDAITFPSSAKPARR